MDTIQNATAKLYIPYKQATLPYKTAEAPAEGTPKHAYRATAISPGVWNGTTFRADTLAEMVDHHNDTGSTGRIRICAEHDDTITSLLGRTQTLDIGDDGSVVIGFDLFDGTQLQRDIITQLEQAPELIGLSILATGNLIPAVDEDTGEVTEWAWNNLRLGHVAVVTWPGCDTTEGSIVAAYKAADGTDFNPAIFTQAPTSDAMADTNPINQPAETPVTPPESDGTKYAAAWDLAQVISLSKDLGIEPSTVLLGTLTPEQAREYAAELGKIAAARQAPTTPPEDKGSAYGAANPQGDVQAKANRLISGTGEYSGGRA